jgi:hypothetical protein
LARREFEAARTLFEKASATEPQAIAPRVCPTHVLLQERKDWAAGERALCEVVRLDPGEVESWRNLAVLLKSQKRVAEALAVCRSAQAHVGSDPALLSELASRGPPLARVVPIETTPKALPSCGKIGGNR